MGSKHFSNFTMMAFSNIAMSRTFNLPLRAFGLLHRRFFHLLVLIYIGAVHARERKVRKDLLENERLTIESSQLSVAAWLLWLPPVFDGPWLPCCPHYDCGLVQRGENKI